MSIIDTKDIKLTLRCDRDGDDDILVSLRDVEMCIAMTPEANVIKDTEADIIFNKNLVPVCSSCYRKVATTDGIYEPYCYHCRARFVADKTKI